MPPPNAEEHATLDGWLDFYRATLAAKCAGLDDAQVRTASVPPSELTLLGLVRHAAEVERNWFRRVLGGEKTPAIFGSAESAEGHDGGFDFSDDATLSEAIEAWQNEIAVARANCAGRRLDQLSTVSVGEVSLRWIYLHMIAEYARHCGHADLIRERVDGTTGV